MYVVFSYSMTRIFFHLGKHQAEAFCSLWKPLKVNFNCVVETFAMVENYPGVYSRQKQICIGTELTKL